MGTPDDTRPLTHLVGAAKIAQISSKVDIQNRVRTYHTTESDYALPNE